MDRPLVPFLLLEIRGNQLKKGIPYFDGESSGVDFFESDLPGGAQNPVEVIAQGFNQLGVEGLPG